MRRIHYMVIALIFLASPVWAQCPAGYQEDAARAHCCLPGGQGPQWENSGYCCWSGDAMFTGDNNPHCCWNMIDSAEYGRCRNRGESTIHFPRRVRVEK